MIALWIVLLVLAVLALLPVGIHASYDAQGPNVVALAGPVRICLYPRKEKAPKRKADHKKKEQKKPKKKEAKPKEKSGLPGGSVRDFLPLVQLGLEFVGSFFRKLTVSRLVLHLRFGGAGDPARAAVGYGRAWAVIGMVMPRLREALRIRTEHVSASCDFTEDRMEVYAELKATVRLGPMLVMTVRYGVRALRQFLALRKKQNNQNATHLEKAVQTNEPSST